MTYGKLPATVVGEEYAVQMQVLPSKDSRDCAAGRQSEKKKNRTTWAIDCKLPTKRGRSDERVDELLIKQRDR